MMLSFSNRKPPAAASVLTFHGMIYSDLSMIWTFFFLCDVQEYDILRTARVNAAHIRAKWSFYLRK